MPKIGEIKIEKGAVVCVEAQIEGDFSVEIGAKTVIHPKARIIAERGPIKIGTDNLIEEYVVIRNTRTEPLIIGDGNIFEIQTKFEGIKIGDRNIFEVRSLITGDVEVTTGCIFGIGASLARPEIVKPKTVLTDQDGILCRRNAEIMPATNTTHITFLHRILPNYHYLKETFENK
ncbi:unnamed protein product [Oikopleura dioica]|uniref:Dynactin subunit 6 n=1 Tax=Oikopleura dioica TaxID=34765 RepID=E4X6L7_OIKDI|nr:unnamed protein product [Oikopleura dioica]